MSSFVKNSLGHAGRLGFVFALVAGARGMYQHNNLPNPHNDDPVERVIYHGLKDTWNGTKYATKGFISGAYKWASEL